MAERWLKDVLDAAEKTRQTSLSQPKAPSIASTSSDRAKQKRIKNQMVRLFLFFDLQGLLTLEEQAVRRCREKKQAKRAELQETLNKQAAQLDNLEKRLEKMTADYENRKTRKKQTTKPRSHGI